MTSKYPVSRYRKTFSPLITSGALSLHGLTQRQLATALALGSSGLTAAELPSSWLPRVLVREGGAY